MTGATALGAVALVALRKESVDRNAERMKVGGIDVVALRKESVDRNSRGRDCGQYGR